MHDKMPYPPQKKKNKKKNKKIIALIKFSYTTCVSNFSCLLLIWRLQLLYLAPTNAWSSGQNNVHVLINYASSLYLQQVDAFFGFSSCTLSGTFLWMRRPNKRRTTLHCNGVSHWLGAYTKWPLRYLSISTALSIAICSTPSSVHVLS